MNTAAFFITFSSTGVFLFFLGLAVWKTILGVVLGGVVAAQIGDYLVHFINPLQVVEVIIFTSLYSIYKALK